MTRGYCNRVTFVYCLENTFEFGKYGRLIVKVAEDEGNLMRSDVWRDILRIDSLVQNIQVGSQFIGFTRIHFVGKCTVGIS